MTKNASNEQVKSHTDYRINREQANTIAAIFRAYADGYGHTTIAKAMNADRTPFGPKGKRQRMLMRELASVRRRYFDGCDTTAPQRGKRGTGSWAPSAIREILYRERYTGKVPFAATVADRPDLRIVDPDLWTRVKRRLAEVRSTYIRDGGHWWGKPSTEKYLLSGMGRCGVCGKSLAAVGGTSGTATRKQVYYYGCSYYQSRGHAVCTNNHRVRMEWLDSSVIESIKRQVLQPDRIAETVEKAVKLAAEELRKSPHKPRELEQEERGLQREIDRFLKAIGDGEALESVMREIGRREERLSEVRKHLASLREPIPELDMDKIKAMCGERLARFRDLLMADVPVARQALRKLLPEPLRVMPVTIDGRRTLRFEGRTVLGPLFEPTYKGLASPRGFAGNSGDEIIVSSRGRLRDRAPRAAIAPA